DSKVLPHLLHGDETRVWGDQAYRGQGEAIRKAAPHAKDFTNRRYRHKGVVDEAERTKNRTKSSVRAKVEHPFLVLKRVFGFSKVPLSKSKWVNDSFVPDGSHEERGDSDADGAAV